VTVEVAPQRLPVAPLVEWVLIWGLGARGAGREEKRAWLVPFLYKGRRCAVGLYKFGLRLRLQDDGGDAHAAANEIIGAIYKAIRVAEGELLLTYAEGQVRAGNGTVKNQYHMFRNMYRDFRAELEDSLSPPNGDQAKEGEDFLAAAVERMNERVGQERRRFHLSVAMVNAYFSLLEHLLVLVWPLTSYTPEKDDPEEMMKSRWGDKFRRVFDIASDPDAKRVYDRLRDVAELYRNTYAHGGFDKARGAFFVRFPGGAIPASLSESRNRLRMGWFPVAEPQIASILEVLDEFDDWLRSGPASLAIRFVDAGIDVPFDREIVAEIRAEMTTEEHFDDYLDGLSRWLDDRENMDW
jgi:hypothetical protein